MPDLRKVLVVGTTPDYIEWIRRARPDRALFLTDSAIREKAREPRPASSEEVRCDLTDPPKAVALLQNHLAREGMHLDGVISFDCESMDLAARIAERFALPYPSPATVQNCRDKFLSKTLWRRDRLHTPRCRRVRSAGEAADFHREIDAPCVLKPLSGSGSELIFPCRTPASSRRAYEKIRAGLHRRRLHRLYCSNADEPAILAEEQIEGPEYSCDFTVDHDRVQIIRLTRKIPAANEWFGTTLGYLLTDSTPEEIDQASLHQTLAQAAAALGIRRAVCMLDFMVDRGRFVLLEMAPRPGGDCLPYLLRRAWGLDILAQTLDFAGQKGFPIATRPTSSCFCGFRIFAGRGGILQRIDASRLQTDTRVLEIHLARQPGDTVAMPPEDYDSWILGHVIIASDPGRDPGEQCREIQDRIKITVR